MGALELGVVENVINGTPEYSCSLGAIFSFL